MSRAIAGGLWPVAFEYEGTLSDSTTPTLYVNGSVSGATVTPDTSVAGYYIVVVDCSAVTAGQKVELKGGDITTELGTLDLYAVDIADAAVSSRSSHSAGDVWGVAARTITGGTVATLTNLPAIPANWITPAGIQDGAFTAAKFAAGSLNGKGDWLTSLGTNAPNGWIIAGSIGANALDDKGNWNKTAPDNATITAINDAVSTLATAVATLAGVVEGIAENTGTDIPDAVGEAIAAAQAAATAATSAATAAGNAETAANSATAAAGTAATQATTAATQASTAATQATAANSAATTANTTLGTIDGKVDQILEDTGTTLPGQIAGITGGSGEPGAFSQAFTVTRSDNDAAVANATVRVYSATEAWQGKTNASGQVTLGVNAGTYTLTVKAAGTQYTPSTLNVVADAARAIEVDPMSITAPTDPAKTTAYATVNFVGGRTRSAFEFKLLDPPPSASATTGVAFDGRDFSLTVVSTDPDLEVELYRDARYQVRRDGGSWVTFTTTDTDSYALPEILGGTA